MKVLVSLLMGSMLALEASGTAAAEAPKSPTDIVRPSQAMMDEKSQKPENATTRLLQHPEALDKALVSLGEELASVDPNISRLLVYVNGLPLQHRSLGLFIWNALSAGLLRTKRFELVDFRESQTAHLTITGGGLHFSNTIDSNDKLMALASRNKAEAVMVAEVLSSEDQFVLTLKLIRASDSVLLWTGRFPVRLVDDADIIEPRPVMIQEIPADRHSNDSIALYGGSLFFGMRRKAVTVGIEDATFWMMPSFGMRGLKRLNDTSLWMGLDMNVSRGVLAPGSGDLVVFTGMPIFSFSVDPLWGGTGNILSVFAGGGPGLMLGGRGFLISGAHEGISLNIPSLPELSVGIVQVPSITVDLYPESNYSTKAHFGGTALQVTVGKNF